MSVRGEVGELAGDLMTVDPIFGEFLPLLDGDFGDLFEGDTLPLLKGDALPRFLCTGDGLLDSLPILEGVIFPCFLLLLGDISLSKSCLLTGFPSGTSSGLPPTLSTFLTKFVAFLGGMI